MSHILQTQCCFVDDKNMNRSKFSKTKKYMFCGVFKVLARFYREVFSRQTPTERCFLGFFLEGFPNALEIWNLKQHRKFTIRDKTGRTWPHTDTGVGCSLTRPEPYPTPPPPKRSFRHKYDGTGCFRGWALLIGWPYPPCSSKKCVEWKKINSTSLQYNPNPPKKRLAKRRDLSSFLPGVGPFYEAGQLVEWTH